MIVHSKSPTSPPRAFVNVNKAVETAHFISQLLKLVSLWVKKTHGESAGLTAILSVLFILRAKQVKRASVAPCTEICCCYCLNCCQDSRLEKSILSFFGDQMGNSCVRSVVHVNMNWISFYFVLNNYVKYEI